MFNTKYKRKEVIGEINSGEIIVDKFDYVPPQVQINRMIQAGERLKIARREHYDFGNDEEVPDDFIDPTRAPDFDLADASAFQEAWELKKQELSEKAEQEKIPEVEETPPVEE